ncbi:CGNR zinc finger domain-containing protein [Kutzneria kofuensis]|uniref:Putative RNA-binding Zn ribbon-like protein n=1 Tax=Kutzneria kofuensis TaxID=103725 RepID=A0A7W9NKA0_9PSEU|nr:CGNR zinc finger domain-containing protein [Kutzneria kofuensis]MBB5895161.1 putative RNA-binding Zn ribbon-like protein [Kutzneria kofuensis]
MTTFPLLGEPLAVDLANTTVRMRGRDVDLIADDAGLAAWLDLHPALGAVDGDELRELRDAVREVFRSAVDSRPPSPAATTSINKAAHRCVATLSSTSDGPVVEWGGGALAVIARSAVEVVAGATLRGCANHDCVLFFAHGDERRKFCDTKTCANRARQARHRERHSGTTEAGSRV